MSFETIIASINEEADRTSLAAMATKYPSLKEYAELGERVTGWKPRLKALSGTAANEDYESNPDMALSELENWRKWKTEKWPGWESEYVRRETALAEATAKVAELEGRSNTDMTAEEIRSVVADELKKAGVATSADVESRITDAITTKISPELDKKVIGLTQRFEDVYSALTPKLHEHAKNFDGEILSPAEVFKHMKATGQMDPIKAYNDMVAPKLEAKRVADQTQAIAAAKAEGVTEGRKAAIAASGRGNPVDGGKAVAKPGPLMKRWAAKEAARTEKGQSSRLGSGTAAAEAARAHVEKEMAGAAI